MKYLNLITDFKSVLYLLLVLLLLNEIDHATGQSSCSQHGSNRKACKEAICQVNVVDNECSGDFGDCSNNFFVNSAPCVRESTYYATGGVLCLSNTNQGTCDQGKVLKAVKISGGEYTYRNIKFRQVTGSDYRDPTGTRVEFNIQDPAFCKTDRFGPFYREIYGKAIYGEFRRARQGCLTYPIPIEEGITGAGFYEIQIYGMEHWNKRAGIRCFDVKLNDQTVIYGLDHMAVSGERCRPIVYAITFLVENQGRTLTASGFPNIELTGGSVDLKLCFGNCGYQGEDPSYQISAISVVRFDMPELQPSK